MCCFCFIYSFTGTNFERPSFQRMIEDIKEGYTARLMLK